LQICQGVDFGPGMQSSPNYLSGSDRVGTGLTGYNFRATDLDWWSVSTWISDHVLSSKFPRPHFVPVVTLPFV